MINGDQASAYSNFGSQTFTKESLDNDQGAMGSGYKQLVQQFEGLQPTYKYQNGQFDASSSLNPTKNINLLPNGIIKVDDLMYIDAVNETTSQRYR